MPCSSAVPTTRWGRVGVLGRGAVGAWPPAREPPQACVSVALRSTPPTLVLIVPCYVQDMEYRKGIKAMELVWRGSASLEDADIFTGNFASGGRRARVWGAQGCAPAGTTCVLPAAVETVPVFPPRGVAPSCLPGLLLRWFHPTQLLTARPHYPPAAPAPCSPRRQLRPA